MNNILSKSKRIKALQKYVGGLALLGCVGSAEAVEALSTKGNKILAGGTEASFAGMSLYWGNNSYGGNQYWTPGAVATLKKDWKANIVRITVPFDDHDWSNNAAPFIKQKRLPDGYMERPDEHLQKIKMIVDAAVANDMYVMIDAHGHHINYNRSEVVAFFKLMAQQYGHIPNVIYEPFNEPLGIPWNSGLKDFHTEVVSAIRAIDPDNLIVLGTDMWSQHVEDASKNPVSGINIAYTLHFYAATHKDELRGAAQRAINNGIPLFVTEWGSVSADGKGAVDRAETMKWVDFMKANKISHTNWSLTALNEGSAALKSGANVNGGWSNDQLTASGALAKEIISGWPQMNGGSSSSTSVSSASNSTSSSSGSTFSMAVQAESFNSMSGVQTESTTDVGSGLNVGWLDAGDWMTYPVNLPAAGKYKVSYRVASLNGGGLLQLEQSGGTPVYGSVNISGTGGWQTWVTVDHIVTLPAGQQTLGLAVKAGGFNINWFKIESVATQSSSSSIPISSAPSTSSSVATSSSAQSSEVGGSCTQVITSDWGTGYTAAIRFTNKGSSAVNGWTIGWQYSDGTKVKDSWNASVTGTNPYSATNLSWNGVVQPGQTVEFGFNADKGSAIASSPVFSGACKGSNGSSSVASSVLSSAKSSVVVSSQSSASSVSSKISSASSVVSQSSVASSVASSATSSASSVPKGVRMDNPFVGAKWYVNQDWAQNAIAFGGAAGAKIATNNTAVWMDRIAAISPADPKVLGLRAHLDAALNQGANLFQVVIYDLPNRDCFALASNGELKMKENGFNRYKNEYITPIAAILADPKYASIRIVAIIEPDSLPNLVSNLADPDCAEANGPGGYVDGIKFTLNTFQPITNVYSYLDIAHSGWLGWDEGFGKATKLISDTIKGTVHGVNSVAGFVSNTSGYTPLREPFLDSLSSSPLPGSNGSKQVREAKFYSWNKHFSEISYVTAFRQEMITLGFPSSIGMLIDTSRNGWGGAKRPKALSTNTADVDTFVNQSRVDLRSHRGMWCNQSGGIGERPTVAPEPGIDAYVWVKPPGESDGVASDIKDPNDPAKGFDQFCNPVFIEPSANVPTGALPNAPHAGQWFTDGFNVLLQNANPAIQ